MGKQAHEFKDKTDDELKKELEELREELSRLRVTQAANSSSSKVNQITLVRKKIARTLTFINQRVKAKVRAEYAGKKYLPKDLRVKKTRALRRALSFEETHVKARGPAGAKVKKMVPRLTLRQAKKASNQKKLKYAVVAEA